MANEHVQRCSVLLIVREMQIRPALRYYFTPAGMTSVKTQNTKKQEASAGEEDVGESEPSRTVGAGAVETGVAVPPKTKPVAV